MRAPVPYAAAMRCAGWVIGSVLSRALRRWEASRGVRLLFAEDHEYTAVDES